MNFEFERNLEEKIKLSFLVYYGKTVWYLDGVKQADNFPSEELKKSFPSKVLFSISSLTFNVENYNKETLANYNCVFYPSQDSFAIIIENDAKYIHFSKEITIALINFFKKLKIENIYVLISRKNGEYIQLIQGLMTAGFEQVQNQKTEKINGTIYKVLKLSQKQKQVSELEIDGIDL